MTHDIGVVILAGGSGTRLGGVDKGQLRLGGRTFLDRVLDQVRDIPEVFLSVDATDRYTSGPYRLLVDAIPDQGPLQGLAQALEACRSNALLAVAVDMPLWDRGVGDYLTAFLHDGCDAVTAVDRSGRRHPLCAVYRKNAAPVFFEQLARGERRMTAALSRLRVMDAPLAHSAYPDAVAANVNTPDDLRALRRLIEPPVLAVCGGKKSGKTTLLRRLIPALRQAGLLVGAIKHDGHDFVPDVPDTDSFFLREAGADPVAIYSGARRMITASGGGSVDAMLPQFRGCDIVILEGGKHADLPKIEILRGDRQSTGPLLAVCADGPWHDAVGTPVVALDDTDGLVRVVMEWLDNA